MAEQKQKKAGLTISLGRRPKVLLLGNGMNRVYGGASWAGLLEKINRTSFTACMGKGMDFTWSAVKDVRLIFSSSPAQEAPP